MSLADSENVTCPESEKIVGHGALVVHGAGDVTLVRTSEVSEPDAVPAVGPPRTPSSELTTSNTGDRSCRTTSPHDVVAAINPISPATRMPFRIACASRLALDDPRRNEDQQLR